MHADPLADFTRHDERQARRESAAESWLDRRTWELLTDFNDIRHSLDAMPAPECIGVLMSHLSRTWADTHASQRRALCEAIAWHELEAGEADLHGDDYDE